MNALNRREALGGAAAALGALGGLNEAAAAEPVKLPSFRFAMGSMKEREYDGGSARQATLAEFPVSKNIAGVSMRLKPGGLRELHWHTNAAEWSYVVSGRCRTTIYDPQGRSQTLDFGPGDVWYFPRGFGHSIQGIGDTECHFILVFDNGAFSDFATFSITDWLAHTPTEVLAKNLGLPAADFAKFPKKEVYITRGPVPPPLPAEPPPGSLHSGPLNHRYHLLAQATQSYAGGSMRIVSSKEFPISASMTGGLLDLKSGGLRELHWHPNADEWQYYISGKARMTVFASSGLAETVEFGPGDVGYVPQGYGHYIENIGTDDCRALLVLNSGTYEDISLTGWLASNPRELVATNFGIPKAMAEKLPTKKVFIAGK